MKLVYGVGINDADYNVQQKIELPKVNGKRKQKVIWTCPYYVRWKDMLARCYSNRYKRSQPTYQNAKVCEEWIYFSKFKEWMQAQDWENKYLDKDIIVPNNKLYSPDTCCFVDRTTNNFLTDRINHRGEYKIGVLKDKYGKRPFVARCSNPFELTFEYLGRFATEEDAYLAWKSKKHEHACKLADIQTDERVATTLRIRFLN